MARKRAPTGGASFPTLHNELSAFYELKCVTPAPQSAPAYTTVLQLQRLRIEQKVIDTYGRDATLTPKDRRLLPGACDTFFE